MDDYIDREAVLMKLMQDGCSAKNVHTIMGIPAADVEPVRHGKWIPIGETKMEYSCSTEWCWIQTTYRYPFCPMCGAKMDGGDEANENRNCGQRQALMEDDDR